MSIEPEATPNPSAMKFTVGQPVGDPMTYVPGGEYDEPMANDLLALEGVASVFATADFVTVTKTEEGDWADISPAVIEILENRFT
ncbi:MAG: scaffolding protein [Acidimicrobiia bacterium]|nr:scaffolding protein [Acidimicrobiia bacterium]